VAPAVTISCGDGYLGFARSDQLFPRGMWIESPWGDSWPIFNEENPKKPFLSIDSSQLVIRNWMGFKVWSDHSRMTPRKLAESRCARLMDIFSRTISRRQFEHEHTISSH
jgi:hypothetical protein